MDKTKTTVYVLKSFKIRNEKWTDKKIIGIYGTEEEANRKRDELVKEYPRLDFLVVHYRDEREFAWETLIGMGVSQETLQVVTSIDGYSMETFENVLYAKFGLRSFDQLSEDLDQRK